MAASGRYTESLILPRAIRFPIEFIPPEEFAPERLDTWPSVAGRMEYVEGRLLYMPPCGETQQYTVTDVVITLGAWIRLHPEFLLGTNEAGMFLNDSIRAADAAVWRRSDVGQVRRGLPRVPPVLAVEVAGEDESEGALRAKAQWYLDVGVATVWLVLPETREVVVIRSTETRRFQLGETISPDPHLPDLAVRVDEFFVQLTS